MADKQRVLIIKLGALGDVVIATPHIATILEAFPESEVHLLTSPPFAGLFSSHERLHVTAMPRKGFGAMWQTILWLRRMRFSVVFDLQGSDRSRVMTLLSGASQRVGLGPSLIYTQRPTQDDSSTPVFERLNVLLQSAGLPVAEPCPQLWVEQEAYAVVDRWLRERKVNKPLALLHAGSSARWLSKRWPEARFLELARQIEAAGFQVVWLGGGDEHALNERLASQTGIDATAAFSIAELAALASRAAFAVVNDSGPMHVISTANIPVYAFFGPTNWKRSHAIGQASRVIYHPVECAPCHLPVCPSERRHQCMEAISVESVLARLRQDGVVT